MNLLEFTDLWIMPALAFLTEWSMRWSVVLLVLLAWLVVRPPRSAATRYLMMIIVLASGVLLPVVPRWARITIPAPPRAAALAEHDERATEIGSIEPSVSMSSPTPSVIQDNLTDQPLPLAPAPFVVPSGPRIGVWQWGALTIAAIWTAAVCLLGCRLVAGLLLLGRLKRDAREVDERSYQLLDDCRRLMVVSRRVRLAAHPSVGSPIIIGGRMPLVLLPGDWDAWSEPDRRVCLLHELAHLSRRDDWVKLAQEIIRIPFFFHPLVRWLTARLDRERELVCDDTVVALGTDPRTYARLLLDLARRPARLSPLAVSLRPAYLPFFQHGSVAVRIERLLEDDMKSTFPRPSASRRSAVVALTLAVALCGGGIAVRSVEPPATKGQLPSAREAKVQPLIPTERPLMGVILDPDGKPAAGVTVVAGMQFAAKPSHQVFTTDNDGRFTWPIPQGRQPIYLVAYKAGLAPAIWRNGLPADPESHPVEIKMRKPQQLSATLIDTAGRPVAGARVHIEIFAENTTTERNASGQSTIMTCYTHIRREVLYGSPLEKLFETTTDQNGLFSLNTIGPDEWLKLGVTTAEKRVLLVRGEIEDGALAGTMLQDTGFVAASTHGPTRFVAFPSARLAGRVFSKVPGVSVAGLRISYQGSHRQGDIPRAANLGARNTTTDNAGRFLIDGLSDGTINVFVEGAGEGEDWTYRAAQDVELRGGETAEVAFDLIRGVDVAGKVVLEGTAAPVVGADLGVYGPFRPRSSAMTRGAKTDAQGRYHYRLPPGETYLYVMGPPAGFTRLPDDGSSVTVTIPADADHYEVPPIKLVPSVTLHGRIVDTSGAPIAGATVVGTCKGNMCVPFPGHERMTDARGAFSLPDGGYNTIPRGTMARLMIRLPDKSEHEAAAVPNDDGSVTVKLALPSGKPAGVRGPADVAPDELAGVVVDTEGRPLEGVAVDAWTWYPGNETRTDARGNFRLRGLEKKRKVEVVFRKPGYSPQLFLSQPTGAQDWVIVLGNKTYFEGTLTDPAGKPVAGALIRANQGPKQAEGVMISEIWTEATTDADGRYRMYAQADVYDIQVRVPNLGVARMKERTLGPDEAQHLDIALERGVTFRARAVDSLTGKAVSGVRLSHWQHKGIEGISDGDGMIAIADMLPGPFSFEVNAPGYARFWSEECATQWGRRQVLRNTASGPGWQRNFDGLDFEIRPDMDVVTITLEPAVIITGQVRDPQGKPVPGATVAPALTGTGNSLTGDTRFSVETDATGNFEMSLPASGEREYNLIAHDGNYQQWRTWANGVQHPFQTKPGERRSVVLLLTRPARVRGRVVDGNGKPVADREVRASAADGLENRYYDPTVNTAADGTFDLKFIRPGEQFIQAAPFWLEAKHAPAGMSQTVTLGPGEMKEGLEFQVR